MYTWGITPISRSNGPRINPPPDPRRPPTVPPSNPQSAQNESVMGVNSIEASQTDCVFPVIFLFLPSSYNFTASYPKTPKATGNYRTAINQYKNETNY